MPFVLGAPIGGMTAVNALGSAASIGSVSLAMLDDSVEQTNKLLFIINRTLQDGFAGIDPRSEDLKREIKSLNSHLSGGSARLEEARKFEKRMRNSPVGERLGK